jgi:DNA-binding LytR/AlgR family response regulator
MHMRMPDRLRFELHVDESALAFARARTFGVSLCLIYEKQGKTRAPAASSRPQGALDYLLKPVEQERLAETVARLKERLQAARPAVNTEALLQQLTAQLQSAAVPAPLRWIRAQVGQTLRLIPVDDIDYLRSDAKYTLVAWRDEAGQPGEAVVRIALKDLVAQLDPGQFAQVHRSVVVNLRAISHVRRHDNETAEIHLKRRKEVLPVSRSYLHLFRQM